MIEKEDKFNKMIDFIGLGSVGVICFLYSLFWSDFAELHIALPFLDFPIFTGEILLFFCVILLFLKWNTVHFKLNNKYWPFLLYAIWVLYRALHGYFQWGPLALRNAALFYYPFFAFIGYHFYRRDFFSQKTIYALFFILVIAKIVAGANFMYYFALPYLMLSIFLILKMRMKKIKYFAFAVLIYSFPLKDFFQGSRSFLVANCAVLLFLFFVYILGVLKFRRTVKILAPILSLVLILLFFKFAPPEKVKSLSTPRYLIAQLKEYDEIILENKDDFVQREIPVGIYNPNKNQIKLDVVEEQERISREVKDRVNVIMKDIEASGDQSEPKLVNASEQEMAHLAIGNKVPVVIEAIEHKIDESEIAPDDGERQEVKSNQKERMYFRMFQKQKEQVRREVFAAGESDQKKMIYFDDEFGTAVNEAVENLVQRKEVLDGARRGRGMQTEYGNILFRILIWREMVEDVIKEKRWFGFSFGKPQRSIVLENSGFAAGEWGRDGWIAPHNAFLHMIYRAGILGFFMVLGIFISLFLMIREFFRKQSWEGFLLVSILVYWIVLASFLVVLELPYQSIPFWTLFGMIFAYLYKDKERISPVKA